MEDILAIVLIFGGGTLAALAFSPIGRAFADRIRGRVAGAEELRAAEDLRAEVTEHREAVTEELHALRQEVGELAERMDFAERLLARDRPGALPKAEADVSLGARVAGGRRVTR